MYPVNLVNILLVLIRHMKEITVENCIGPDNIAFHAVNNALQALGEADIIS